MSSTPNLVISNTSPLLYLHQIGCLSILQTLYTQVIVPQAVQSELLVGQQQGVDVPKISQCAWLQLRSVATVASMPNVIDLGPGEAEVIGLGIENPGSLLILDDQLGRQIARFHRLTFTGTLGVLIKAKQLGHITTMRPLIEQLQRSGMWLSESIIADVLRLAGES
jgi:uncharacterized protein